MNVDRRTLLKGTVGGSLLLAMGAAGLSLQPSAGAAPPALKVLTTRDYAILRAVGEALIDVPPGLPGIEESGCLLRIDALLHALHPATAAEVKQVLALLENPVLGLIDFRVRPLSRLAPDARRAILARWQQSSIPIRRTAIRAVHGLLCANYWADKRTHAYMGYAGPPAWALQVRMAGGADDG